MAHIFLKNDFKIMSWKNGGGVTTELFVIDNPKTVGAFLFRLSVAKVNQNGPFSLFNNIERTLMLLDGSGFLLEFISSRKKIVVTDKKRAISFSGEEEIRCSLIDGSCTDFNVMVDSSFGEALVSVYSNDRPDSFYSKNQLFLIEVKKEQVMKLHKLEKNERYFPNLLPDNLLIIVELVEK